MDIYAFIAFAVLRRSGQLSDDDERFLSFVRGISAIFDGTDVWNGINPSMFKVDSGRRRSISGRG